MCQASAGCIMLVHIVPFSMCDNPKDTCDGHGFAGTSVSSASFQHTSVAMEIMLGTEFKKGCNKCISSGCHTLCHYYILGTAISLVLHKETGPPRVKLHAQGQQSTWLGWIESQSLLGFTFLTSMLLQCQNRGTPQKPR